MSSDEQTPKPDVVFVHGPAEKGDGLRVIRANERGIQIGEMHAVKEGEAIRGDLVKLSPRKEHRSLFDVEVLMAQPSETTGRPAQVATSDYRRNFDSIFGTRPSPKDLPN